MVFPYKWFRFPFAISGDLTAIPDTVQVDGSISYPQGFGPDYALDPATQPAALDIPRNQSNQLYNDITTVLQYLQAGQTPAWIDSTTNGGSAYSYTKGATVLYTDGVVYESLVATNTTTPGTDLTKWRPVGLAGIMQQLGNWVLDTGAVNVYAIAPLPAVTANAAGLTFRWMPAHTNTSAAAPTLAVGSAAAKGIVHIDGSAIQPGEIVANGVSETVYNPTLDKHVLISFTPSVITGNATQGTINWPGTKYKIKWTTITAAQPGVASDLFTGGFGSTTAFAWDSNFDVTCIWAGAKYPLTANGNCTFGLCDTPSVGGGNVYTTSGQSAHNIPGVVVLGFGV